MINSTGRSQFVAEENIRLFVHFVGENNVGVMLLTLPGASSTQEFQKHWNSFLTHSLKKRFASGMWTRERQPGTGDWHAQGVVDMGYDIKTGYPFAEVKRKHYGNVAASLRADWKLMRTGAKAYGFGWNGIEPIKRDGWAAAKYLAKYLSKAQSSEFHEGEERARLFGIWGKKRYVSQRFSWYSPTANLRRAKLARIAALLFMDSRTRINSISDFKTVLGRRWSWELNNVLSLMLLPVDRYACCLSLGCVLRYWDRDRAMFGGIISDKEAVEASDAFVLSQLLSMNKKYVKTLPRATPSGRPKSSRKLREINAGAYYENIE